MRCCVYVLTAMHARVYYGAVIKSNRTAAIAGRPQLIKYPPLLSLFTLTLSV